MYGEKVWAFQCGVDAPVVETQSGRLRGFSMNGVYQFRGIPYAQAKRFMAPEAATPWAGVRNAQEYGYVCPLLSKPFLMGDFTCPHRYWPSDEQCLNLNVWTKRLDTSAKQPVMVWLHGGGFSDGSSIEQYAYDGENLARDGDVVVVSVNHRLNVLGFCDVSDYGEDYRYSGIAGMLDIAAALAWVRENIAAFGGDRDNVTIFGQSGGGGKVSALMQMPSADGLYARAIIQSGVIPSLTATKDQACAQGRRIAEALGGIEKLSAMPYEELAAGVKRMMQAGEAFAWAPVPDGESYLGEGIRVGFRRETAGVPVLVGSTLAEFTFGTAEGGNHAVPGAEKAAALKARYGDAGPAIQAAFRQAYPELDDYYALQADSFFRLPAMEFVRKRSALGAGKVYNYVFAFESAFQGGLLAPHCSEIPFVFRNAENLPHCYAEGVTHRLQEEVSGAWLSFARSGAPAAVGMGEWPAWSEAEGACAVFGNVPAAVRFRHDETLLALLAEHAPLPGPGPDAPPVHH